MAQPYDPNQAYQLQQAAGQSAGPPPPAATATPVGVNDMKLPLNDDFIGNLLHNLSLVDAYNKAKGGRQNSASL